MRISFSFFITPRVFVYSKYCTKVIPLTRPRHSQRRSRRTSTTNFVLRPKRALANADHGHREARTCYPESGAPPSSVHTVVKPSSRHRSEATHHAKAPHAHAMPWPEAASPQSRTGSYSQGDEESPQPTRLCPSAPSGGNEQGGG
jgi:hypothetical protein